MVTITLMKIKDSTPTWPPTGGRFGPNFPMPVLDDTVFSAWRYDGTRDHVRLKLRNEHGTEYIAAMQLPAKVLKKLIVLIQTQTDLTLREVGELDIP